MTRRARGRFGCGLLIVAICCGLAMIVLEPSTFGTMKRGVRLALGLPKNWVTRFNDNPAGYVSKQCPGPAATIIITGGQSNAANALADPLPVDPLVDAYMFSNGKCWRLRDPVLGATSSGGSLWTHLGSAIFRETRRPVVFINGGVGGSQLGDWLDDRSQYRRRLSDRIADARRLGMSPGFVLWVQGETDAAVHLPPERFVAQLRLLIAAFDKDGATTRSTRWVIYRSTRCKIRSNNGPDIDRAVRDFASSQGDRIIVGPLASALGDDKRRDGCHFNGHGREALTMAVLPLLTEQRSVR